MSFTYFVSSTSYPNASATNFTATVYPVIDLGSRDWEVAITGGQIVNTLTNLSAAIGNNTMTYSTNGGTTWKNVTFADGIYTTTGIQTQFAQVMQTNGDYTVVNGQNVYPIVFSANLTFDRVQVQLNANCLIDLSTGTLYQLLGFLQQQYNGGAGGATFVAPNLAQFTNPSNYFMIYSDLIEGGVQNVQFPTGILKIVTGGDLGLAISLEDFSGNYDYFPVKGSKISQITFTVYDAFGRVANLLGESTSFKLRFRKIK